METIVDLEHLLSTLKGACLSDPYRRDDEHYQTETNVMIYRFRHWCYTNKLSYDAIIRDVFTSERGRSLVLQWFKHHRQTTMYNHLVQIIAAHCQQQRQQRQSQSPPAHSRHRKRPQHEPQGINEMVHDDHDRDDRLSDSLDTPSPHIEYEYSPALLLKPEETERDLQSLVISTFHSVIDRERGIAPKCRRRPTLSLQRMWIETPSNFGKF